MASERPVNGDVTRAEEAKDIDQLFNYTLDLEDAKWLDVQDKKRIVRFVEDAAQAISLSRKPECRWFEWRKRSAGECR